MFLFLKIDYNYVVLGVKKDLQNNIEEMKKKNVGKDSWAVKTKQYNLRLVWDRQQKSSQVGIDTKTEIFGTARFDQGVYS